MTTICTLFGGPIHGRRYRIELSCRTISVPVLNTTVQGGPFCFEALYEVCSDTALYVGGVPQSELDRMAEANAPEDDSESWKC